MGSIGSLFPSAPDHQLQWGPHEFELTKLRLLDDVPLAALTALEFAYLDLCNISVLDEQGLMAVPVKNRPAMPGHTLGNLRSGQLNLGSVYGKDGLGGDISAQFERCLHWPWDRARLWRTRFASGHLGDVLRLHRVISGDGAVLDERFFEDLPPGLRKDFFDGTALKLERAVIPDQRNDRTLLLSQFHSAVYATHNAVVDILDDRLGQRPERWKTFEIARERVTSMFVDALIEDVLPLICDQSILAWSRHHQAPLFNRMVASHRDGNVFPAEAATVIEALLAVTRPAEIRPNLSCAQSGSLPNGPGEDGLPREHFQSASVPTRLSPASRIDWRLFLPGPDSQTLATSGRAQQQVNSEITHAAVISDLAQIPSGQDCVHLAEKTTDLKIPVVTPQELASALGPEAGQNTTPLYAYVLAEARIHGTKSRLGPLGSLIVAETFIGAVRRTMPGVGSLEEPANHKLRTFLGCDVQ